MERSLVKTALFISLFPNLLSGPILSWRIAAPQLTERICTPEKTAAGLRRFILGLAKKLLIADITAGIVDAAFAGGAVDARLAWLLRLLGYGAGPCVCVRLRFPREL